jgi:hypothetical protein
LNDEADSTVFLYLALGMPSNPASTFDDGMTRLEFVLVKCRFVPRILVVYWLELNMFVLLGFCSSPAGVPCDFTRATVPE